MRLVDVERVADGGDSAARAGRGGVLEAVVAATPALGLQAIDTHRWG